MVYRCIAPPWLKEEQPGIRRTYEGEFDESRLKQLNSKGYNVYFLPNYPNIYHEGETVDGSVIDVFRFVFVDYDCKSGDRSKADFLADIQSAEGLNPSILVDSGNGIHAYWEVSDLDAMSYLKLQRRLCRRFDTDPAVSQIYQLMRAPGYNNTKTKGICRPCVELPTEGAYTYTCEQLDALLPPLTVEDAQHCEQHFNKTYRLGPQIKVDTEIPKKFEALLAKSQEVKDIWSGNVEDRSAADFRLGHLMLAAGLTKDEATSVLVNSEKARDRAPHHRLNYATNIVDKVWQHELEGYDSKAVKGWSNTVRQILNRGDAAIQGVRFPCYPYVDATERGFRLGDVIGLVAGAKVGKTSMALNMFMGFVEFNPDYDHFFVPLEQPDNEIAARWQRMCGDRTDLHDKVHVLSNYAEDGKYRNLSLEDIKNYILEFQTTTGRKVGCVVIDHIGVLKKGGSKNGENQDLMAICQSMKAFAIETKTLLVMQSQAPREKAGAGDLELDKSAAYGTVFFEAFCDYMLAIWQPLKRCYSEADCPCTMAYKFCAIRHKRKGVDIIQEDVCYRLVFDPTTELLRPMTDIDEKSFDYFNLRATNIRARDRKSDLIPYVSTYWITSPTETKVSA